MPLFAVYMPPTNELQNKGEADKFYESLQSVVRWGVPERDMALVLEDFNFRLLDFCTLNNLVITNTLFQHRPCYQHIWFHLAAITHVGHAELCSGQSEVQVQCVGYQSVPQDLPPIRSLALKCKEVGCGFIRQSRAGLVNHAWWQRHGRMARVMDKYPFCEERFCKPELPKHIGSAR